MEQQEAMETSSQDEMETVVTSATGAKLNEKGLPDYTEIEVPPMPEPVMSTGKGGPRLMITYIQNENFKSYAGVVKLGPFTKSFSSIIGPNGSGKSNVIDSILFVFGYRAAKIRSKKLSVLIHSSDKLKDLSSCSVCVKFQKIIDTGDGPDEYEVVPDSEFSVSRTAFKDNSSYYKLNNRKVTYKEVATVLRASGIDLDHNRFLILQGEVEQIAMMKPKGKDENDEGMLEFLEDIIGSSRYHEPIDLLSARIEELSDIRQEKLNRVKSTQKEKDNLEGPKNEAIAYLTLENDIVKEKNKINQIIRYECSEAEKKATNKRDEIKEGMSDLMKRLETITKEKMEKADDQKKIFKESERLKKECEEQKAEFSAFEQRDVTCRESIKHAKAKMNKLTKQLEAEKSKLEELKAVPEVSQKEVEVLNGKLEKLEGQKEEEEKKIKDIMDSLKTETQGLQAEKDVKETELIKLQEVKEAAKSKFDVAQNEHSLYLSNQSSEESKLKELKRNYEQTQSTLKDRKSAAKDLEQKIPESTKALEKARHDMEEAGAKQKKLTAQWRETRDKVDEARSSQQQASRQGRVIGALMEQKRMGKIKGIYGRLGDLGAIDMKYDVAISTACGSLDNIVVDSINTAQICVQYLKKNNIGSATFIGLDKMERWKSHCSKRINPPENVHRLFDLVQVTQEEVLPAFYFALRDTLVAKDLEQATRIAYGRTRYRVVTLSGQLIDISGTMSGGGNRVSKGKMGSKVVEEIDPKLLIEMENKLKKEETEAKNVHENYIQLEEMVRKLQKTVNSNEQMMEKINIDLQSMADHEKNLKVQVKEQEARYKAAAPDPAQLKKMESNVKTLEAEYKKCAKAADVVEEQRDRLHQEIMAVGGTQLKAAEARMKNVQSQMDLLLGKITKANLNIKNAKRNTKKCEEKVNDFETEKQETETNLVKLNEEFKTLEESADKLIKDYEQAMGKLKEVEDEVKEINVAVAKLEQEEEELQKGSADTRQELDKFESQIKENQQKIKHLTKEIKKLSLQPIDGEEQGELPEFTVDEMIEIDKHKVDCQIQLMDQQLKTKSPNLNAIAEFKKKERIYLERVNELEEVTEMRDSQRQNYDNLRKRRLDEFMAGFAVISNKLKEMYQMITLGGDAELELLDSLDPFTEGIVFSVRPPKKSWKNISNLSGGERTLSSLALVFALHHYRPTPLYVMDEIDAALDFKNVSIVANYIKERTKNAQFIIISLRNNMYELADILVGIYKTFNCTKTQRFKLHDYNEYLRALRNTQPSNVTTASSNGDHLSQTAMS